MEALKARLTSMLGQLFSQSPLAGAINYALNHWDGLTLFLDDGRVEVDTNTVERSMRPIAWEDEFIVQRQRGRRRELGHPGIAGEHGKLHELDPQAYLADVLERIVSGRTKSHRLHDCWLELEAARARSLQAAA